MTNTYLNKLVLSIILFFLALTACSDKPDFDINNDTIKNIVEQNADSVEVDRFFPDEDVRDYLHGEFHQFYKDRDYKLAWLTFDAPTEDADELLEALDASEKEGMSPEPYDLDKIEALLADLYNIETRKQRRKDWRKKLIKSKKFKERFKEQDTVLFHDIVRLDFLMTANYLTYASHLLAGKIRPDETADWYSNPRKKNLSEHLNEALDDGEIMKSLQDLAPPHPQYDKLKEQLARFREIEKSGGWDKLNISTDLKEGSQGAEVLQLRKRLAAQGYLQEENDSAFDSKLQSALKRYQMHHGLKVTGAMNDATMAELNKPVEHIIEKISFNMERMRWIHGPFGDHYVLVNIPAFQMTVIKDEKAEVQMKAIVGEQVNKTPVFNDSLEYIVFSPEWNVPRSIAVDEMLPRIKRNPGYLPSRNFKLFENWERDAEELSPYEVDWDTVTPENFNFRIVEGPGRANSLGLVKFIFPNSKSIYLHDTPAGHLFSENQRDFSHGCIRLEKPKEFAQYLLSDRGWDINDVEEYMNKSEPSTVLLGKKLPVYIVYWTAWVDDNNNLNLRDDIYSYDAVQMEELEKKNEIIRDSRKS